VTKRIPWFVPGAIDVGADSTVDVAKADNHGQSDAAFVGSFDVVRHPGNRIGNNRINTTSSHIDREVRESSIAGSDKDDVPGGTQAKEAKVEVPPVPVPIRSKPDETGNYASKNINRNSQKVGRGSLESELNERYRLA